MRKIRPTRSETHTSQGRGYAGCGLPRTPHRRRSYTSCSTRLGGQAYNFHRPFIAVCFACCRYDAPMAQVAVLGRKRSAHQTVARRLRAGDLDSVVGEGLTALGGYSVADGPRPSAAAGTAATYVVACGASEQAEEEGPPAGTDPKGRGCRHHLRPHIAASRGPDGIHELRRTLLLRRW